MNVLIAVKSGYYFALVPASYLHDIDIEPTGQIVAIPEKHGSWPLYKGKTYDDVKKYDAILDSNVFAIYEIASYVVGGNTPTENSDEEKVWEVTVARTGVAFIKCKASELQEKANALTESEITWTDDWSVTDTMEACDEANN